MTCMKWKEAKKLLLKNDPMLKIELERLEPKYQVIRQVIELRKMLSLSQQELAKRINDKQSNIARLEINSFLYNRVYYAQIAEGLNAELEIKLIPRS